MEGRKSKMEGEICERNEASKEMRRGRKGEKK